MLYLTIYCIEQVMRALQNPFFLLLIVFNEDKLSSDVEKCIPKFRKQNKRSTKRRSVIKVKNIKADTNFQRGNKGQITTQTFRPTKTNRVYQGRIRTWIFRPKKLTATNKCIHYFTLSRQNLWFMPGSEFAKLLKENSYDYR